MATNNLEQTITLNSEEYVSGLKEANDALKSTVDESNKKLTENSGSFKQNETQVKKWGSSVRDELQKFRKEFTESLATGAKALTLGLGAEVLNKGLKDTISQTLDADKAFAALRARVGGTEEQFAKFDKTIGQTAIKTKTSIAALSTAFFDLSDSFNPEDINSNLKSIGDATLLAGGDSGAVSGLLKHTITNKEDFTKANVDDTLGAASRLSRNGQGFGSLADSAKALSGLDQTKIKMSGMSESAIADAMAAMSKTAGGAKGGQAGMSALLAGIGDETNPLNQILGGQLMKGGKFNVAGLGSAGAVASTHRGTNEQTDLSIFKQMTGLSGEEGDAIFKTIRAHEKFEAELKKSTADTRTLGETAKKAGDNLLDDFQQIESTVAVGMKDIFGGFKKPLQDLLEGHPLDAGAGAIGATGHAIKSAVIDHPLITGAAIATTAVGGALIKSLGKGVFGKMLSGAGGTAAGVVEGKALQQAGVTPVFVVNAGDIGGGGAGGGLGKGVVDTVKSGAFVSAFKSLAANAGVLGGASVGEIGAMGAGAMGMAAVGVGAAGLAGYGVGTAINSATGNDKGELGAMLYDWLHKSEGVKVKVEVNSKDPHFSATPKANKNQRDARTR